MTLIAIDMPLHGERMPAGLPSAIPQRMVTSWTWPKRRFGTSSSRSIIYAAMGHRTARSVSGRFRSAPASHYLPSQPAFHCKRAFPSAARRTLPRRVRSGCNATGLPPDEIELEVRSTAARLAALDPIRNAPAFKQCALMMIHGVHDQSVPLDSHRILHDALAPYFIDHPEDLLFLTHAGKHGIRRPIEEMGWTWLIERLRSSPGPGLHPLQSNLPSG